jgi:hypothetical protein
MDPERVMGTRGHGVRYFANRSLVLPKHCLRDWRNDSEALGRGWSSRYDYGSGLIVSNSSSPALVGRLSALVPNHDTY